MGSSTSVSTDDLNALVVLMADCRDEIAHATQTLERLQARPQDGSVQAQLEEVLALLTPRRRRPAWWWLSAGVLVCLVWGAVGWTAARWAFPVQAPACVQVPASPPMKGSRR